MESTYLSSMIHILTGGTRVPQDWCAYTCMPRLLGTFPAYQKPNWEKPTIGGDKRYYINVNRYLDVWQYSNIFPIVWLSKKLLCELLQLLSTIITVIKHLPCTFWLFACWRLLLIMYNAFDPSGVYNILNFPNLFLVLLHIFRRVSPCEWF